MTQSSHHATQGSAAELAKRTPEEIFAHHAQSLGMEDPDAVVLDYADTASLITPAGVLRGKDAIRDFFVGTFQALPQAKWEVKATYVDNVLFLEWTADSRLGSISDGVDTFIFDNGLIQIQTARFTLVPR
ncbi:MAG: nuclear transport factor 2 family protein [Ktedonobacteraceae bacterium]